MDCTVSSQQVTTFRCLHVRNRIGKVLDVFERLGTVSMRPWNGEQIPDEVPLVVTLTHTQDIDTVIKTLKDEVGENVHVEIEPSRL